MKRALLCTGIGAGLLFGFEPFAFWMAGVAAAVCMILLAESLEGEPAGKVLIWSAAVCLSITVFAFQWIAYALAAIAQLSWPAAILVTLFYAVLVNLKIPFFILASRMLQGRLPRIFVFPLAALAGDLLFYQIFPWYWGNAAGSLILMQSARIFGVYGVSFLLFLVAAFLLEGLRLFRTRRAERDLSSRGMPAEGGQRPALWAAACILICTFLYGTSSLVFRDEPARVVRAAYIQPATKPALNRYRNNDEFASQALSTVFNLGIKSLVDSRRQADLLILPESSVPFLGTHDSEENIAAGIYSTTYHAVIAYLSRYGSVDVVYNELNLENGKLRNQATLFGFEGIRRSFYNKQHLVPFGEYLPFEDLLPLRRFFPEASRYVAGETPRLLEYRTLAPEDRTELRPVTSTAELSDARTVLKNWPARPAGSPGTLAPLVCYEGLFPGLVRAFAAGKPDFFVNIANDAWFGDYLENYQHSGAVRLRAIESGRSVVRITLTGVSTAFGPDGENLSQESRPGEMATGMIEVPVYEGTTVYTAAGNWPLYGILAAFLALALFRARDALPLPAAFGGRKLPPRRRPGT